MLTIEQIKEALKGKKAELDAAEKALTEAGEDEEKLTAAKTALDKLVGEIEGLAADLERAEKLATAKSRFELVKPQEPGEPVGKDPLDGAPAAKAVDHAAVEGKKLDLLLDFVCCSKTNPKGGGRPIELWSGQERDLVAPSAPCFTNGKGGNGIVVPDSIAVTLMGPRFAQAHGKMNVLADILAGKTVYSTNDPASGVNPSQGQNLVPPNYIATLLQLPFDQPALMDRVTMIQASNGSATWPSLRQTDSNEFGAMVWTWAKEGKLKDETEPIFDQVEIEAHELEGYTEVSNTMLRRSAINIPNLIAMLAEAGMRFQIDGAFFSGSGVNQPLGFINTAGIRTVARQAAGAVERKDVIGLKYELKAAHKGGALFYAASSVLEDLELDEDNEGRPIWSSSAGNGLYDRLSGREYIEAENCPNLGTAGDLSFLNPRYYFGVMEKEITIAQSEHYKFRNNVTCFAMFAGVGGQDVQPRSVAILDDAES